MLHELEDVIRDWIVAVHQAGKHDGLTVPEGPGLPLSPNEMFTVGIGKAGRLRLPARPDTALEFHRVAWRTIQHYGVEVNGLIYNEPALDGHRNQTSPYGGIHAGKWPIRVNDEEVRMVHFQEPADGLWHDLEWEHVPMLGTAAPITNSPQPDEAPLSTRPPAGRPARPVNAEMPNRPVRLNLGRSWDRDHTVAAPCAEGPDQASYSSISGSFGRLRPVAVMRRSQSSIRSNPSAIC
ncbi:MULTISPECIES: hypothetical protein [unclassified Kitasatospora]|uniref:hypothetical protein n=1 Tax=unclassified Kitasatospora TaxID=2633591 RepID=UPI0033FAA867